MKKNLFYKTGLDTTNSKECFEFLTEHFTYYTLSSWNGLESIANNVKVYNLGLDGDAWNVLALLEYDDYFTINRIIEDWEDEHPGYKVGFNGRSGGYLVLYNEKNNLNVLPDIIADGDYEDFKQYCKDYYGSVKNYKKELVEYVRLVQDFDKLCDDLRYYVNKLSMRDMIENIVEDKLELFNDEYYTDLKQFNIGLVKLNKDKTITITDKMNEHMSLIDCLLNYLQNDHYNTHLDFENKKITFKEV